MLTTEARNALIALLVNNGHIADSDWLRSCQLCRALAGLERDNAAGMVYSAVVDIEQSCQGEDDHLVSFGGVNDKYHYHDGTGKPVESHFLFNKALWEVMGEPDKLEVMFRRPAPEVVEKQ